MYVALPLVTAWLMLGAAPTPRLGVVEPASPPMMQGLAAQVAGWVVQEAQAQKVPVVSPDELAKTIGEAQYASIQACRGELDCVLAQASSLKVPRVVVGTLERDDQSYLVHLWLLDIGSSKVLSQMERSIRIATRRLGPEVRATLPGFLRGELPRTGELELTASVAGVYIQVDGNPAGQTPVHLSLSPGRHEVEGEKPGFLPSHHWVSVTAGKTTREDIELLKVPGHDVGLPPEQSGLPLEVAAPKNVSPPRFRVPLGTYIAGGVAVGALAAGLGLGFSSDNIERRLVASYDPVRQVYGGTRADALAGRDQALAANILFGTAGAAALTALGFLIFTPPPSVAHSAVSVDSHGVTLTLGGEF